MSTLRKHNGQSKPAYRTPAPADYFDEVTDEHMAAVRALVQDELEGEKPIIVSGPAW